jgi:hypothetical protein
MAMDIGSGESQKDLGLGIVRFGVGIQVRSRLEVEKFRLIKRGCKSGIYNALVKQTALMGQRGRKVGQVYLLDTVETRPEKGVMIIKAVEH